MKYKLLSAVVALLSVFAICQTNPAMAAEESLLEPNLPVFNSIPVQLHKDNLITRELGGRALNLDIYAGLYGTYEDNIYQTADDKKDDWVTTPMLGFLLNYTEKDAFQIFGNGQVAYKFYSDHDDLNDTTANVVLGANGKFNDFLAGTLRGGFVRGSSPSSPTEQDVIVTNTYNAAGGFTISPSDLFDVELGVGYTDKQYDQDSRKALDFSDVAGFIRPVYKLSPYSEVSVKGMYGDINHSEDVQNDSTYYEVSAGYKWTYLDTAMVDVELGYQNRDYDNNGTVNDDNSYSGMVIRVAAAYMFVQDWQAALAYSHTPREPENLGYNYEMVDSGSLQFVYNPRESFALNFGPYMRRVDPSQGNFYTEWGGNIGASYSFTELLSVGISYIYIQRDYDGGDDWDDNKINVGVNLTL